MFDKEAMTYARMEPQPTGEEVMSGLNYALCMIELSKYKVAFASKESIEIIKEKSNGISIENIVFVEAPVDHNTICAINDNSLKYTILLDKGLIQKSQEFESRMIIYARKSGKSPFSLCDIKEERVCRNQPYTWYTIVKKAMKESEVSAQKMQASY